MGIVSNLIGSLLHKATITRKSQLTPHTVHIRLEGKSLEGVDYIPGYFLRVLVGKDRNVAFRDNIRSYSAWAYDPSVGAVDTAICTDGGGSGSEWAKECTVGDIVAYSWHKTPFMLDQSAENYLFIGDFSALGHLYGIARALPDTKHICGIIHGSDARDYFSDMDGTTPFAFVPTVINPVPEITSRIPSMVKSFSTNSLVYIGGDSRVCTALHRYFREELHWDSRRIKAKPFWNPVKKGLE